MFNSIDYQTLMTLKEKMSNFNRKWNFHDMQKKNAKTLTFDLFEKINVFYLCETANFSISFARSWYLIEHYANHLRRRELMSI